MTTGGWIFMLLTWGIIITILIACYSRIMSDHDNEQDRDDYRILD